MKVVLSGKICQQLININLDTEQRGKVFLLFIWHITQITILNTLAITSAVSLKSMHFETLDFARNSSINRVPIL